MGTWMLCQCLPGFDGDLCERDQEQRLFLMIFNNFIKNFFHQKTLDRMVSWLLASKTVISASVCLTMVMRPANARVDIEATIAQ